jgi:hypothetical protein
MSQPYNTDDATEERLAGYFEEIYQFLSNNHVADDRLPSPWHILSHIVQHTDYETFRGWLEEYVVRESDASLEEEDGDLEDDMSEVSKPGVRLLRPIDKPDAEGSLDGEQEEDGS